MTDISALHSELWTSWASLLRSYAAAHGLHASQHAVIEVSAEEITLRVGSRWLRCTRRQIERNDAAAIAFCLNDEGTVTLGRRPAEEMDLAAEQLAREMLAEGSL